MMARMNKAAPLVLACMVAGCQGSAPARNGAATSISNSAVLVRARLSLPSGELHSGFIDFDIESDVRNYRLRALPETTLYVVEPGAYRFSPVRGLFGKVKDELRLDFNGRTHTIAFPLSLLRHNSIVVKPHRIVSIGIVEAKLERVSGSLEPKVSFSLVEDRTTQKSLVEDMIHKMMDKNVEPEMRETAVAWSRALQEAMVQLQEVQDASPTFKPGPR